jgi:tetratricopeptide (TPR) repeat protein
MKKLLAFIVLSASAVVFAASDNIVGTIVDSQGTHRGAVRYSLKSKTYFVTAKQGGALMEMEIAPGDVSAMEIDPPAGWDQAVDKVSKGQGASAISYFAAVVKKYNHLQWDLRAARYLADAYLASGNVDKAFESCMSVVRADQETAYKGELAPIFWKVLVQLGKKEQLEKLLNKAAVSGDRYSSGAALIGRGDLILASGESAESLRQALVDGYLRVALMYTDGKVAEQLRPEAMAKAATCFEKIGQAARADQMRSDLRRLYPNSTWAKQ